MVSETCALWEDKVVRPDQVLDKIQPGMSIFIGTGVAEPRTLIKHLLVSDKSNLEDLELIQLISLGEAIQLDERYYQKFRLKTFFAGWVASEAITSGRVDMVPCRMSVLPRLISSGAIKVDAVIIQITRPDQTGYSSFGLAVDVARQAIDQATLVVGEINDGIPCTLGDTLVHVDEFDYLVESSEAPMILGRWPVDAVFDKVARNVAEIVEDGACICFSYGPLYEGLGRHLAGKKNLGVHSLFITDALMDLIKVGAVTNRRKGMFKGKSLASYAFGTTELIEWLHRNPLVEFQGIDVVANPANIGSNRNYMAILPARKVDLTGNVAMPKGKGAVAASMGAAHELCGGAAYSKGGRIIFALPSRNLDGRSNIRLSIADYPNQMAVSEWVNFVVTEYGAAHLTGRTVRERAMALIDVAHPDDRSMLVREAKDARILYADQIFIDETGHLYPDEAVSTHTFKNDLIVRFRAIKPSDEDDMRRLFYRFSSEAVYYRYFSPIKSMPHAKMQEYVNVNFKHAMSIVGLVGEPGGGKIVAEARYVKVPDMPFADLAFIVDEQYHGYGIATYMFLTLIRLARERGIAGMTADVLTSNIGMWKVLERSQYPLKAHREDEYYHIEIPFTDDPA